MSASQPLPVWQIQSFSELPAPFLEMVKEYTPGLPGHFIAQLLWQRGIHTPEDIATFLNCQHYQPTSAFAFGTEMEAAVSRIFHACDHHEKVAIWGDFDADGITATAVLWDGLGQFFPKQDLSYYIPNRLQESHGLNNPGIEQLAANGITLIITCDTGSTNIPEIEFAQTLGIDIIVTDHHTLPATRPPVIAILNPRFFPPDHPLFHLSGVAVAYKLIEALYQTRPHIPQQPLATLLDLVAIGLIADLVQLKGDTRYLAQIGIQRLQQQDQWTRPGIVKLLELCKSSGDRPMDISFGIGPRINAVSRIQGDSRFCVELLTHRDPKVCEDLARQTELANTRRKALQNEVVKDVKAKLADLDLSTTGVIVLVDSQWPTGVLGLVAGQIAQEYNRPTILLTTEGEPEPDDRETDTRLARGSARSIQQIDLYQLVEKQSHLLHRFGGHPFAAGLSLPVVNLPLFMAAINRQLREQVGDFAGMIPMIGADLTCTVAQLGRDLFQELKLLEPCGMGNPAPKLFIANCWFENLSNQNISDLSKNKVRYIKTEFEICDQSRDQGFPGVWWGHYREEVPEGRCDAIIELDYHATKKDYQARLIAVRPVLERVGNWTGRHRVDWIIDQRSHLNSEPLAGVPGASLEITECPTTWDEWRVWFRKAHHGQNSLVINYPESPPAPPITIWHQLLGIAKYLSRTGEGVTRRQICQKLGIREFSLQLGFQALKELGFQITYRHRRFYLKYELTTDHPMTVETLPEFLSAIQEEQFQRHYFCQIPINTLEAMADWTLKEEHQIQSNHF